MEAQLGLFDEPNFDAPIEARHASFTQSYRSKILYPDVRKFCEVFDRASPVKDDVICRYPVGNRFIVTKCIIVSKSLEECDFITMVYVKPTLSVARGVASAFIGRCGGDITFEIIIDGGGVANTYAVCNKSGCRELIAVVCGETVPVPKQLAGSEREAA